MAEIEDIDAEIEDVTEDITAELDAPISVYENDYERLKNQPKINDITLVGNKNLEDLNVEKLGYLDILRIWNNA